MISKSMDRKYYAKNSQEVHTPSSLPQTWRDFSLFSWSVSQQEHHDRRRPVHYTQPSVSLARSLFHQPLSPNVPPLDLQPLSLYHSWNRLWSAPPASRSAPRSTVIVWVCVCVYASERVHPIYLPVDRASPLTLWSLPNPLCVSRLQNVAFHTGCQQGFTRLPPPSFHTHTYSQWVCMPVCQYVCSVASYYFGCRGASVGWL